MSNLDTNFTSRSPAECYQRCHRKRFIDYFWLKRGISPIRNSDAMITGSAVHEGLEIIHKEWLLGHNTSIDVAISKAIAIFETLWGPTQSETDKYHFDEQRALVEAQLRAYAIWLLPKFQSRYVPIAVEQEISFPLTDRIVFEARPDLLLLNPTDKDVLVVDYKTLASYDTRREKMVSCDLQGETEAIAAQKFLDRQLGEIASSITALANRIKTPKFQEKVVPFLFKYLEHQPVSVSATKMVFLVKGIRKEEKIKGQGTGKFVTSNPLIYGYYQDTPSGKIFAHSQYYPNPNNASGWGKIGSAWHKFAVWESLSGGVKEWIETITAKVTDHQTGKEIFEIQPECGDILEQQFWLPVARNRNGDEAESTIRQIARQESDIFECADFITNDRSIRGNDIEFTKEQLDHYFPIYRHSCHYPSSCPNIPICYKSNVFADCLNGDFARWGYKWRTPNHPLEREQHLERFGKDEFTGATPVDALNAIVDEQEIDEL